MGRFGVVLGGGGVLCAAELGMLQALAEWGLKPDAVAGTSGGGILAGALGAGVPLDALIATLRIGCARPERYGLAEAGHLVGDLVRRSPAPGLLTLRPLLEDVLLHARANRVSEWAPGYGVTATNLGGGGLVYLQRSSQPAQGMSTIDALQATSAFPGLFSGVRTDEWAVAGKVDPLFSGVRSGEWLLCDGGLIDNVPGDLAVALGADVLLAMSFDTASGPLPPTLSPLEGLYRAVDAAVRAAQRPEPSRPSITLAPALPAGAWLLSLGLFEQLLAAGHEVTTARRAEIETLVEGAPAA